MKTLNINLDFNGNNEESIKETILNANSHLTFVNDYEEAEKIINEEWGFEDEVLERIGTEKGFVEIEDTTYRVVLSEYYADSGSEDYVYRVEVEML